MSKTVLTVPPDLMGLGLARLAERVGVPPLASEEHSRGVPIALRGSDGRWYDVTAVLHAVLDRIEAAVAKAEGRE